MSPNRWKQFRIVFVVCVVIAGVMIYEQGGFERLDTKGGIAIMILSITAVRYAIYRFVRGLRNPEDPFNQEHLVLRRRTK
jgi:hypothetical protein